ncbi:MAG: GntR family transcriptional regulator [Desulfobacterales bacterium]|nr:GntR family transcriptional regulator [Desulfobacterales bacterium]
MNDTFFKYCQVNSHSSLPKYQQLKEAIISAIEQGFLKPGMRIPAEMEITRNTGMSLGTVQKALKSLNEEGIILRKQGHGTFVSKKMFEPLHCRFVKDDAGNYFPVSPTVIDRKIVRKDSRLAREIAPEGDELIRMDRIINLEGGPFSIYNQFYLPLNQYRYFMDIPIKELHGSNLKKRLRDIYNITITKFQNYVSMAGFPPKVCEALGLEKDTLGMLHEVVSYSSQQAPVYFHQLYIPPSELKLQI